MARVFISKLCLSSLEAVLYFKIRLEPFTVAHFGLNCLMTNDSVTINYGDLKKVFLLYFKKTFHKYYFFHYSE